MISAYIGDTEVVSDKDFTITEELSKTSSTILNNCYPKSWEETRDYISNFFFPRDYSPCEIYQNDSLLFSGIVKNSGDVSLRFTDPKYCSLQILDYKCLLSEGDLLDFVISDKTIEEAVTMVLEAVKSYNFVVGDIRIPSSQNDKIKAYSTLNKSPYDVLQYLADLCQAKWYTRRVDSDTIAVDFWETGTHNQTIYYTQSYFEQNNIIDLSFSFGTRDYRNKQTIISDKVFGNVDNTETMYSNGYQTTYNTYYTIGQLKSVYVDGVEKSVGTTAEKELGIYADFYYNQGENFFESRITYPVGTTITATYIPIVKGRQIVLNNSEVSRISNQIGGNGIISRYEKRNDVLSSDELNKIAQTYIKYKGTPEILLKVQTKNNDLFYVGEEVAFNMPSVEELNTTYLVKKKETQITKTGDDGVVFYTYTLSSSFNSETAINYFDNQRNKANGNISEGDFITRNIDYAEDITIIFDNLRIEEETIDDNVLSCTLGSPLTK